ncbi:MAG TPA: hypothetical protein VFK28_00310 [Sphingomicrobium sp.]|jgi:hypothetical protein|nr:hypothetical protein [Sphingomicrobium sp.]
MRAASVISVEKSVDRLAALLFAAACAFAAYAWLRAGAAPPLLAAETAAAGLLALYLSLRMLSAVQPASPRLPVPIFDVREVEPFDETAGALADSAQPPLPAGEEPLLLDDILTEIDPDSRVVRLFDPAAMPTAGELQSRIDRHLEGSAERNADAAQALHDALAELRRSIR